MDMDGEPIAISLLGTDLLRFAATFLAATADSAMPLPIIGSSESYIIPDESPLIIKACQSLLLSSSLEQSIPQLSMPRIPTVEILHPEAGSGVVTLVPYGENISVLSRCTGMPSGGLVCLEVLDMTGVQLYRFCTGAIAQDFNQTFQLRTVLSEVSISVIAMGPGGSADLARAERYVCVEAYDVASKAFVAQHNIVRISSMRDHLLLALAAAPRRGAIVEFGVYKGVTITFLSNVLARADDRRVVIGFDAFRGLLDAWREGFPSRSFDLGGVAPT